MTVIVLYFCVQFTEARVMNELYFDLSF